MRLLKTAVATLVLALLAACSFQSAVILPDVTAAGDPIAGLPTDAPFRLESFDRQRNAFRYIGTMTPEMAGDGHVRYTFTFAAESLKLLIQAQKLSEHSYILRYAELGDDLQPKLRNSTLVFLTAENGTYYILTSLADKKLFDKIFDRDPKPTVVDDVVDFDTLEQAAQLSAYFAGHRSEFLIDRDYVRMRLAK